METLNITLSQINACLNNAIKQNLKLPRIISDFADDEDNEDLISYYILETQNWDILNNNLFTFDKEETITITYHPNAPINCPFIMNSIIAFSSWVSRSYEDETYPWETNAWTEGYCSGDDDVDYNSSYLDCVIACIEYYLLTEGLTKREFTTYNTNLDYE